MSVPDEPITRREADQIIDAAGPGLNNASQATARAGGAGGAGIVIVTEYFGP